MTGKHAAAGPEAGRAMAAPVTGDGDTNGASAASDAAALADLSAALAPLRERIDAIDNEIVALLNERARIALEIGRVKDAQGEKPIRDPAREAAVIERVTSASEGLFPQPELVALYRKLIAGTRKVQAEQRRARRPADCDPT
jgi:chorismate mutase / prephenate dehydratase